MKPRQPDRRGTPAAWLRAVAPAILYLLAGAILMQALARAASGLTGTPSGTELRAAGAAATPLLLLPCAWLWNRRDRENGSPDKSDPGRFPPSAALWGAGVGLALGLLSGLIARMLPALGGPVAAPSGPSWLRALRAVSLCAAGPLCEEIVYRGLVFRRAEALLGAAGASLLSAALFAAGHGSIARLPVDFAAGLAFAGVMLWQRRAVGATRALIPPALCHMAANLAALLFRFI